MLTKENFNLLNTPIFIDKDEVNHIIDLAIENDPSLIVGKIIPNDYEIETISTNQLINEQKNASKEECSALTILKNNDLSTTKHTFLRGLRISFKVAISTLFLNIAKLFI